MKTQYNSRMRVRILVAVTLLLALIAGYVVIIRVYSPRLVTTNPAAGSEQISKRAPVRLEFSRSLVPEQAFQNLKIDPPILGQFNWQDDTLTFTPDQPWPSSAAVQIEFNSGARASGFPWLPVRETTTWEFHISNNRLAYLWPADGPADLYSLDPITGDIQRLTEAESILDYTFSTDGRWVYFSADNLQGGSQIARIDLAVVPQAPGQTYRSEILTSCPQSSCQLPQSSPDGRLLAYERVSLQQVGAPESKSVWIFDLQTGSSSQVSAPGADASAPAWSATGLLAFYDLDSQSYRIYDPAMGILTSLPNQTGEPGIWQPDGEAFVALEVLIESSGLLDPHGTSHLIRYELTESGNALVDQIDISRAFDLEDSDPAFSPIGTRMAFSRRYLDPNRWTPGRQLWVMDADGGNAMPLTDESAYHHYAFAWSQDGSQIAFIRFDPTQLTQPPELWLIGSDGSDAVKLINGGFSPQWMP